MVYWLASKIEQHKIKIWSSFCHGAATYKNVKENVQCKYIKWINCPTSNYDNYVSWQQQKQTKGAKDTANKK